MNNGLLLNNEKLEVMINRLCFQLIENHNDFSESVIIGLQPRGVFFAARVVDKLNEILGQKVHYGKLDTTFFRDDVRSHPTALSPNATQIDFIIENKKVILIDDVLYTGRSIRAALDAMLAFGRPAKVELMVLIDRRFARHLPIEADYIGHTVDSINSQKVKVKWLDTEGEDAVYLI